MFSFLKSLFGPKADFPQLLKEGAVVIDVRTKAEFKQGHAKGSINIPLNTINNSIEKIRKYDKPIITCCRSGNRSGMAARILKQNGMEAYNAGPWQRVRSYQAKNKNQ
jgi:rhodanese-related sulfurtransferase